MDVPLTEKGSTYLPWVEVKTDSVSMQNSVKGPQKA